MNILAQIVASKQAEIAALEEMQRPSSVLSDAQKTTPPLFYQRLAEKRAAGKPFFITEFKRKSPSEGWIQENVDLPTQLRAYVRAGASAISVLTDGPFFGGSLADLQTARQTLDQAFLPAERPLLLQKDFILDPLQVVQAHACGADLILLIAAILSPERLDFLRKTAESLGMGVLVEVHDAAELAAIQHLDFPVLGVNNRDLKTFRTALNRVNTLLPQAGGRFVIAESGVLDARHFQMVKQADGFLIGTGLMQTNTDSLDLSDFFAAKGRYLCKACGIRRVPDLMALRKMGAQAPDFWGINFSPRSKRRADNALLSALQPADYQHAVAVFYQNTPQEVADVLAKYPFKIIQHYADDCTPEWLRSSQKRVLLAVTVGENPFADTFSKSIAPFAADVDAFILDGAMPGSGIRIQTTIPPDFPYPFLLAGGMNAGNLEAIKGYTHCIGVDMASGIETEGVVDEYKIGEVMLRARVSLPHDFSNCL